MKTATVFLLLVVMTSAATAEVYRWTDENGQVHFGDRPPRNSKAEDISAETRSVNVDQSRAEREKLNQLFAPETAEEKRHREQKEAQLAAERQALEAKCEQARKQLRFFQEDRFYWVDDEGKTSNASEAERERVVADLNAAIQRHCR